MSELSVCISVLCVENKTRNCRAFLIHDVVVIESRFDGEFVRVEKTRHVAEAIHLLQGGRVETHQHTVRQTKRPFGSFVFVDLTPFPRF